MPTATVNHAGRRAFVLEKFRVQGARTPHGEPQNHKELVPYCEEVICEGLYGEIVEAVARQDPALASIAGVSNDYLLWAVDMTMYYFIISSIKSRGIISGLDATGYFTFQFPKPEKWVLNSTVTSTAMSTSTSASASGFGAASGAQQPSADFAAWMQRRQGEGLKIDFAAAKRTMVGSVGREGGLPGCEGAVAEKLAARERDDMDDLVDFMREVVL